MASGSTRGAFIALTIGGVLAYSGLKGLSIVEVLAGDTGAKLDPRGGRRRDPATGKTANVAGGSPRDIIENTVIPMAQQHGIPVTAETVAAANARHSTRTLTGGTSDHAGPGNERWAADMSNGKQPTPEMDALAADIAAHFGIPWNGSGARTAIWGDFEIQLIYRSLVGGNHYNHVHCGIHRRRDQKR